MSKKIQPITALVDQFSRTISYLRLSVTDRCNLRCKYCMPEESEGKHTRLKTGKFLSHSELLSYEELLRVVNLSVSLGMTKIRLTGGEPLVRKNIIEFIQNLTQIEGLEQVRLTTNGVLLYDFADKLYEAGVEHINVSLDTLQRAKYKKITGRDSFDKVWAGLMKAVDIGFKIKLNAVAMKNVNDNEFKDFGSLALKYPFQIRFIEFMPVGGENSNQKEQFIESDKIQEDMRSLGTLQPCPERRGDGPARMYDLKSGDGRTGKVGFISPISHHFCDNCNRLRLTSEGKLRACLLTDNETDLKDLLRNNGTDEQIVEQIRKTILKKPQGHNLQLAKKTDDDNSCNSKMSRIGG